jgi:hypothetical protein
MPIAGKALEQVTQADLQELIDDEQQEGKLWDFKRQLPGTSDDAKREFARDVCSFANTAGGHIVFGMREERGVAAEILPLPDVNIDDLRGRFEQILYSKTQPRIVGVAGIAAHAVPVVDAATGTSGHVVMVRIPNSILKPHMVFWDGGYSFYARNSNGKYALDVQQLRDAFLESAGVEQRIRNFRLERIGRVASGETPSPLEGEVALVTHVVPLNPAVDIEAVNPRRVIGRREEQCLAPLCADDWHEAYPNFDGFVTSIHYDGKSGSYMQLFHNGSVEFATSRIFQHEHKLAYAWEAEDAIISAVERASTALKSLGVEPPVLVMVSLTGVRDYCLYSSHHYLRGSYGAGRVPDELHMTKPLDRDILLFPGILVEQFDPDNTRRTVKPVLDRLWQAVRHQGSPSYDQDGDWKRH